MNKKLKYDPQNFEGHPVLTLTKQGQDQYVKGLGLFLTVSKERNDSKLEYIESMIIACHLPVSEIEEVESFADNITNEYYNEIIDFINEKKLGVHYLLDVELMLVASELTAKEKELKSDITNFLVLDKNYLDFISDKKTTGFKKLKNNWGVEKKYYWIEAQECTFCKKCYKACKFGAINLTSVSDEDTLESKDVCDVDIEKCTNCRKCIEVCPQNAITDYSSKEYLARMRRFAEEASAFSERMSKKIDEGLKSFKEDVRVSMLSIVESGISSNRLFVNPNMSMSKIVNFNNRLVTKTNYDLKREEVEVYLDVTLMGGGRDGLCITRNRLFINETFEIRVFNLEEISSVNWNGKTSLILVTDNNVRIAMDFIFISKEESQLVIQYLKWSVEQARGE